eukprot:CAMPEP_0185266100 /NCGR_PEP_ID=MMETSP1359-20130426/29939_1 /TAXON_ID=552665 /ORGANISM="Bigelowiella longifila, Strain CCMP242" /LENGTH=269 /DNA_ID=CAMNT_0027855747 /DNA_START=65 /DNA_END=874 /DNA_ORIENTATION=+
MAKSRFLARLSLVTIVSATAIYIHSLFSKDVLHRGISTKVAPTNFPGIKGRVPTDSGSVRLRLLKSERGNPQAMNPPLYQHTMGAISSRRTTNTHAFDSAHEDVSKGGRGLGKGHFSRESGIGAPSRPVSVRAGETVRGRSTIHKKQGNSITRGLKPAYIPDGFASISQSINNVADNTADFFAGLSPKMCSTSMDCRREHAFDDRVGYECCSYGVVNMCCFPPDDDDDDWKGGWGRPLVPELQLVPIPIRKQNLDGYGGAGQHHGGYPY